MLAHKNNIPVYTYCSTRTHFPDSEPAILCCVLKTNTIFFIRPELKPTIYRMLIKPYDSFLPYICVGKLSGKLICKSWPLYIASCKSQLVKHSMILADYKFCSEGDFCCHAMNYYLVDICC